MQKRSLQYIVIGLVLFSFCSCYVIGRVTTKDNRTFRRKYLNTEYGFVKLNDTLWVADAEVTNGAYKKFLQHLAGEDSSKYGLCQPDTSLRGKYTDADAIAKHYFKHPAFDYYPVVGISWYAANEYCKWLSGMVSAQTSPVSYLVRLPTESEWNAMVAEPDKAGLDVPCPGGFDTAINCYCFNFWVVDSIGGEAQDGGYFTVRADAYWPNKNGIFNLHGNVAEMTADPGLCKGGGWNDSYADCSMFAHKFYSLPSAEVGIRLVAVKSRQ